MFFSHLGGAWGFGDIPRRRPEKIAYRARPKPPQSNLCGAEGSCLLDRRHLGLCNPHILPICSPSLGQPPCWLAIQST